MPNYKLKLEYNGENFHGSQAQNLDKPLRTVQGELEACLNKLLKTQVQTVFAGRTDKGVHAIGQVVNFQYEQDLQELFNKDLSGLCLTLNSNLPEDMAVTKVEIVGDNFNARFDAKSREYLYKIFVRPHRPVLRIDSLAWFKEDLDFDLMQEHCKSFIGKKDFAAYAKEDDIEIDEDSDKFQVEKTTICEVFKAELVKESKICYKFHIKADRFLRNMVRRMVGELVHVGKGLNPDDDSKRYRTPATGLTLMKVEY